MTTLYAVAKCARANMFYGDGVVEMSNVSSVNENVLTGEIDGQLLFFSPDGHLKNFDIYFKIFTGKQEAEQFASKKKNEEAIKAMLSDFDIDADVLDERDINDLVRIHNKLSFVEVK